MAVISMFINYNWGLKTIKNDAVYIHYSVFANITGVKKVCYCGIKWTGSLSKWSKQIYVSRCEWINYLNMAQDFAKMCRTCLDKALAATSLFSLQYINQKELSLAQMLRACTSIVVNVYT